jgi:hypothetical protein
VTNEEAAEAINNLARQMTRRTLNRRPSQLGIVIVIVFSAAGIGALWVCQQ